MGGSLISTDGWFGNTASQVSSHSGIGLSGETHNYVGYKDRAWTNGILETGNKWPLLGTSPNHRTLTIETEDLNVAYEVTNLMYKATVAECKRMLAMYPGTKYLMGHSDISPRSRPNCPGDRWRKSGRMAQLSIDLNLQLV